ncbi:unnamed protein product [Dicrocoelium dendriticum]|nr:unnamed protein product [Dicrocoelium dendriticum]
MQLRPHLSSQDAPGEIQVAATSAIIQGEQVHALKSQRIRQVSYLKGIFRSPPLDLLNEVTFELGEREDGR